MSSRILTLSNWTAKTGVGVAEFANPGYAASEDANDASVAMTGNDLSGLIADIAPWTVPVGTTLTSMSTKVVGHSSVEGAVAILSVDIYDDGVSVASNSIPEVGYFLSASESDVDIPFTAPISAADMASNALTIECVCLLSDPGTPATAYIDHIEVTLNYEEATMSANTAIISVIDNLAKTRQVKRDAIASRTRSWDLIDAAGDETFENRVKGTNVTAFDDDVEEGGIGPSVQTIAGLFNDYFIQDLELVGSTPFEDWLDTVGIRVPWDYAEELSAIGMVLSPEYVFPKGTMIAPGDPAAAKFHKFGTAAASAVTTVDGALPTTLIGGAVLLINETSTTSVTNLILKCYLQDAETTKNLTVTLSAADQWAQTKLGAQAIGAAAAASGQKVVPVAATAQFTAGEWVMIVHDDASQEKAQIDSIVTNTSLTMESNLINSYAENDLVLPLFTNVEYVSGSVSASDSIGIYAMPDRTIAI